MKKIKIIHKVIFVILLIPTIFTAAIIAFTIIYGKEITEGSVKVVGNNLLRPIIISTIIIANGINQAKTDSNNISK
jgi:hypothetical protein